MSHASTLVTLNTIVMLFAMITAAESPCAPHRAIAVGYVSIDGDIAGRFDSD